MADQESRESRDRPEVRLDRDREGHLPRKRPAMGRPPKDTALIRPWNGRWIGGVCLAIARRFDLDPVLVRLIYLVVSLVSAGFPGIIVYLVLWVIIPSESRGEPPRL
jgi:phage shock protein C